MEVFHDARVVATARYENGRWGANTAYILDNHGVFLFFNGYSDPWSFDNEDDAVAELVSFMMGKTPA